MSVHAGGPLLGVRVVELAGIGPAQHGAMLLADLGADVVRVDRLDGDASPPADPAAEILSRGRRSIAVDLKSDHGRSIVSALIEEADVLIDPYRPGVTERLGIGPDDACGLNPRLVYVRMTGWGQTGPPAHRAGDDRAGGGMLLAFGTTAALLERERSGQGQVVDVATVDSLLEIDGVLQPAPAPRFSRTPGAVSRRPPRSGEHTAELLAQIARHDPR
jgi:alpha-methylacyl-CoA racemase